MSYHRVLKKNLTFFIIMYLPKLSAKGKFDFYEESC